MTDLRFMVFAGYDYYPGKGVRDLKCLREALETALEDAHGFINRGYDWAQVYDVQAHKVVLDLW